MDDRQNYLKENFVLDAGEQTENCSNVTCGMGSMREIKPTYTAKRKNTYIFLSAWFTCKWFLLVSKNDVRKAVSCDIMCFNQLSQILIFMVLCQNVVFSDPAITVDKWNSLHHIVLHFIYVIRHRGGMFSNSLAGILLYTCPSSLLDWIYQMYTLM